MAEERTPDRWWNAVIEIRVPFDTPEEAREAFTNDETYDRLFDMFGEGVVIGGSVEEMIDE